MVDIPGENGAGPMPVASDGADILERSSATQSTQSTGFQDGTRTSERPIGEDDRVQKEKRIQAGRAWKQIILNSRNRKALSPAGKEYLEMIKASFTANGNAIKLVELPTADGAYLAVDDNKNAIELVFDELQRSPSIDDDFVPACTHITRINNDAATRQYMNTTVEDLLDAVIIPESDYTNDRNVANTVASTISTTLANAVGASYTFEGVEQFPIRLVTNQTEVAAHMMALCPEGVLPYYQVGVAVEICIDEQAVEDYNRGRNISYGNYYNWIPLLVMGAATEFLPYRERNGDQAFTPLVTITACESIVKSIKMMPLMLAIATEMFISKELWLEPFKNWGAANSAPNLGMLLIDPGTNALPEVGLTSEQQFVHFLETCIGDPLLAVDIRFGAWNHPAFERLLMADGLKLIQEELEEMDPAAKDLDIKSLVADSVGFYCGTVINGNRQDGKSLLVDSRSIDYFEVLKCTRDLHLLEAFQVYTSRPEERLKAIAAAGFRNSSPNFVRNSGPTIRSLYDCAKIILNAPIVCDMVSMNRTLRILKNLQTGSGRAFDMSMLREQGRFYNRNDHSLFGTDARGSASPFASFNRYFGNSRIR